MKQITMKNQLSDMIEVLYIQSGKLINNDHRLALGVSPSIELYRLQLPVININY